MGELGESPEVTPSGFAADQYCEGECGEARAVVPRSGNIFSRTRFRTGAAGDPTPTKSDRCERKFDIRVSCQLSGPLMCLFASAEPIADLHFYPVVRTGGHLTPTN